MGTILHAVARDDVADKMRVNQRGEVEGKGGRARTVVDREWAGRGPQDLCSLN